MFVHLTKTETVPVATMAEASRKCREFIELNGFGSREWSSLRGGDLRTDDGRLLGRVSYNGRVWKPKFADGELKIPSHVPYAVPQWDEDDGGYHMRTLSEEERILFAKKHCNACGGDGRSIADVKCKACDGRGFKD